MCANLQIKAIWILSCIQYQIFSVYGVVYKCKEEINKLSSSYVAVRETLEFSSKALLSNNLFCKLLT